MLGVGHTRVVDQTEDWEQSSGLLVTEHDGVGLQQADGPHHVLLGEVEAAGGEEEVHDVLLVFVPHVGLLLPLLLVVHQEDQPSEPLGVSVLLHEQPQWRDALIYRRLAVLVVLHADLLFESPEDLTLVVVGGAHLTGLAAHGHVAEPAQVTPVHSLAALQAH